MSIRRKLTQAGIPEDASEECRLVLLEQIEGEDVCGKTLRYPIPHSSRVVCRGAV